MKGMYGWHGHSRRLPVKGRAETLIRFRLTVKGVGGYATEDEAGRTSDGQSGM